MSAFTGSYKLNRFCFDNGATLERIFIILESKSDFLGDRWKNTVASNNDYPHAPWWNTDSNNPARSKYNPTAILSGFLLQFSAKDSAIYKDAFGITHNLSDSS